MNIFQKIKRSAKSSKNSLTRFVVKSTGIIAAFFFIDNFLGFIVGLAEGDPLTSGLFVEIASEFDAELAYEIFEFIIWSALLLGIAVIAFSYRNHLDNRTNWVTPFERKMRDLNTAKERQILTADEHSAKTVELKLEHLAEVAEEIHVAAHVGQSTHSELKKIVEKLMENGDIKAVITEIREQEERASPQASVNANINIDAGGAGA